MTYLCQEICRLFLKERYPSMSKLDEIAEYIRLNPEARIGSWLDVSYPKPAGDIPGTIELDGEFSLNELKRLIEAWEQDLAKDKELEND